MRVETAIILAGGDGRRMGGIPKWKLDWKGETLLERGYRELMSHFNRVLVSTRVELDIPFQQITDIVDAGSLGGIYSSLVNIGEPAFFCAVDMPLMTGGAARSIADMYTSDTDVVIPLVEGRYQTLAAVYSPSVIPYMREQIISGNYRIRDLLERVRVRRLDKETLDKLGVNVSSFENVNTPDQYRRLLSSG